MESLSSNIFVTDIKATVDFYKILGFSTAMSVPENGDELVWAMMTNGGADIMFQTFEGL